jgi:hypothetical protein
MFTGRGSVAKRKGLPDPEETSVHGLPHDIGKVVLVLQFPAGYQKIMDQAKEKEISVYEAENEYFSMSYATVGACLAKQWSLHVPLIDVINHHRPRLAKVALTDAVTVHFSDIFLRVRGFGFAGDYPVPPMDDSVWELTNISQPAIRDRCLAGGRGLAQRSTGDILVGRVFDL